MPRIIPLEGVTRPCEDCKTNQGQRHAFLQPDPYVRGRYRQDPADQVPSKAETCNLARFMMGCAETLNDDSFKIRVSNKLGRAAREFFFLLYAKDFSSLGNPGVVEAWDCYSTEKTPWPEIRQLAHIPQNPLDETCLGTLRGWIQDCNAHHNDCQPALTGQLPTRVIDVGSANGQEPRLYISSGEKRRYTTLSYRWGTNLNHCTVKANLQQRLDKIPYASLPALYQDAITVTRGLGIQYIWIDSICILQDDTTDWEREAGSMASVYGHSYLCISASCGQSPDERLAPPRIVPLSYTGADFHGQSHTVYLRPAISHQFVDLNSDQVAGLSSIYPTLARGWCFQERYLSPRIVHYDQGEMIWECRETFQCECTDIKGLGYVRGRGEYSAFIRKALDPNPSADFDFVYDWATILQQYSATNLTYEGDILPALSGIATQVMSAGKGPYLAGLWREGLERQMYWRRMQARTPKIPTAPSFSPLSRIGNIEWFGLGGGAMSITVLNAACEPSGPDPTGAVAGGFVTIRGPVLAATVQKSTTRYDSRQWCTLELRTERGTGPCELEWDPDAEEELERMTPGKTVVFLRLCAIAELVLVPHGTDEGVYVRVGISNAQTDGFLDEATVKTVTIK